MKTRNVEWTGLMESVETYEGESIEEKVERIVSQKEPITDGAPMLYTKKQDGVMAGFNIRTDRFDIALEGMDKVNMARRDDKPEVSEVPEKIEGGTPSEN